MRLRENGGTAAVGMELGFKMVCGVWWRLIFCWQVVMADLREPLGASAFPPRSALPPLCGATPAFLSDPVSKDHTATTSAFPTPYLLVFSSLLYPFSCPLKPIVKSTDLPILWCS